jgi:hypothetical protein
MKINLSHYLMIQSIHLGLMDSKPVAWSWMWYPKLMLCYATVDMFLQPDVNQTACMSSADMITFRGDTVYSWCLQSQVVIDWQKETRELPQLEAN